MSKSRSVKAAILVATHLALAPAGARAQSAPAQPPAQGAPAQPPGQPPAQGSAAQPPAPALPADLAARAASRKAEGDEAMEGLRHADALAAYSDAYAITRNPALLYNMGRALQALNRFPEALEKIEAFDAAAPADLKAKVPQLGELLAELRARVSTLTIRTNVTGARVIVRNVVVGKWPLQGPLKLAAGPAEVEIDAEGFFPAKQSVELPGGSGVTLNLDLYSRVTNGILSVRASAPGAEVSVDGKRIGVAPLELNVTKGTHQVVVRHPDYRVYETTAVVPANGTKEVTASLQSKSVVTKWWFWTAAGAVVAAGVAATIVARTERGPDSGTLPPGRLPAAQSLGASLIRF